jgi:hypothetical protein
LLHHDSHWVRIVDTSLNTPDDFNFPKEAPVIDSYTMTLKGYSVVILMAMKKSL